MFLSILIKYGLIRQKFVRGDIITIILNDQWNPFIPEYKLVNVEVNKSKIDVLIENNFLRRDV